MNILERRILECGRALNQDVLLVDSFLNHQVDMRLMQQIGEAFAERFSGCGITRVLTIESSGIAPAGMTALCLSVPLVVLKKKQSRITDGGVYQASVQSFTKGTRYEMTASKQYLPSGENVLLIDDFLAMGEAAIGAAKIMEEAGCVLAGVGIVIEKSFQPGRERLHAQGIEVFSLARIARMSPDGIEFARSDWSAS